MKQSEHEQMMGEKFLGQLRYSPTGFCIESENVSDTYSNDFISTANFTIGMLDEDEKNTQEQINEFLSDCKGDFIGKKFAAEPEDELVFIDIRLNNKWRCHGLVLVRNFYVYDRIEDIIHGVNLNFLNYIYK